MKRILFALIVGLGVFVGCNAPADAQCVGGVCRPQVVRTFVARPVRVVKTEKGQVLAVRGQPVRSVVRAWNRWRPLRRLFGRRR